MCLSIGVGPRPALVAFSSVLFPCCFLFKGFYLKPILLLESSRLPHKTNVSLFNISFFFFILERRRAWYLRVLTTFLRPKHDETNSASRWLDSKHQRYVSSVQNWSNHVSSNKPLLVGPRREHVESVRFVKKSARSSPAHLKSIHLRLEGGAVLCNCIRWRPLPDITLCVHAYSTACVANNKATVTVLLLTLPVFNDRNVNHETPDTARSKVYLSASSIFNTKVSFVFFLFLLSSCRRSAPTLSVSCSPTTAPTSWPVVPVPSSQCVPSLTWGTGERWAKNKKDSGKVTDVKRTGKQKSAAETRPQGLAAGQYLQRKCVFERGEPLWFAAVRNSSDPYVSYSFLRQVFKKL